MSNGRASIFDTDTAADFDVSEFAPKPRQTRPKPDKREIRAAAEQRGFTSREPEEGRGAAPSIPQPAPAAVVPPAAPAYAALEQRRRQRLTGRNRQLNLKVTEDAIVRFYALADGQRWGLGEAFEHAVAALEKELGKAK